MLPNTNSEAAETDLPVGEAQVPEQTPGEGSANEEQPKEQPLTLDQVRELIRSEVNPLIQSQVAKSENRTDKRIQERFAALEQSREALNLTDEQVEAAQTKIIREEQMNALKPKGPTGNESQPPAASPEAQMMFVNTQIDEVVNGYGVEITPADKEEWALIQNALRDPKGSLAKTLVAADKAASAKAERVNSFKGNAPARTVSDGQATSTNKPKPKTAEEKISTGLRTTKWRSDTPQK